MARKAFDAAEFVKEHRATKAQVEKGEAKVCTAKGCACGNVPLTLDAFYRDKSQADGHSPWCKAKERSYNAKYYEGLKAAKVTKKGAITTPKGAKTFEATMASERVARGKVVSSKVTTPKARAPRKAATPKVVAKRATRTSAKVKVTA